MSAIFSFSYLLGGVSIFASALFTALNNGGISALISLVRTLVMRCGLLILLPALLGIDGVWLAVPVAEVFAALLAAGLLFGFRRRYGYWPGRAEKPVHADKPGRAETPGHAETPGCAEDTLRVDRFRQIPTEFDMTRMEKNPPQPLQVCEDLLQYATLGSKEWLTPFF